MSDPIGTPLVSLIVDLASFRHRLAAAAPGAPLPTISLVRLADRFASFGVELREIWVARPFIPITLGSGGSERHARRVCDEHDRWWRTQRGEWLASRHSAVRLRPLFGGFTGRREVGVDVLVAAAAHEAADQLSGERGGGVAVVCSHDSDLYELHRGSADVPIVIAGQFSSAERRIGDRLGTPRLVLTSSELNSLSEGTEAASGDTEPTTLRWRTSGATVDLVLTRGDGSATTITTRRLRRDPAQRSATTAPGSPNRTAVIADPYGITNGVIRSLGVGKLPTPASITDLVLALGWPAPIGIDATIPDVSPWHPSTEEPMRRGQSPAVWWEIECDARCVQPASAG